MLEMMLEPLSTLVEVVVLWGVMSGDGELEKSEN